MSDLYSECIVKRVTPKYTIAIKLLIAAVFFIAVTYTILTFSVIPFLIATVLGVIYYVYSTNNDLEYEYTFVNGELDIDKIMNKARRRRALVFDFNHLEIMAPKNSYHLDGYKNKSCKVYDFTSLNPNNADKVYAIYGTDKNEMIKILIEPDERMLGDIRRTSPSRVKMD